MERRSNDNKTISQIMLRWLLIILFIVFAATVVTFWIVQTDISEHNAEKVLALNLSDVRQDISDTSDANLLELAKYVAESYDNDYILSMEGYNSFAQGKSLDVYDERTYLAYLADLTDVLEVIVIDDNGIITDTSTGEYIGYDMASGEQSAEFMPILTEKKQYVVQPYGPISYDNSIYRKYAGWRLDKKSGFIQVAYGFDQFREDISNDVVGITKNRHVGRTGSVIITDGDFNIVSGNHGNMGKNLFDSGFVMEEENPPEMTVFRATVFGEKCDCMYTLNEGYYITAVLPRAETNRSRNIIVAMLAAIEFVVFVLLYVNIYRMLKHEVADKLDNVTLDLDKITDGDLDLEVDVRGNKEFISLSDNINKTVCSLKGYIAAEAARIDTELEYARNIQASALPSVFPPYPEHQEKFDIYAAMRPAREVGGDFYDFFMIGNDKLVFVVADVSGKGIPASLFMMRSKALIKSNATTFTDPGEVLKRVNEALCEGNEAGMFVTAWLGILNLQSGVLKYANAGHNPPLIKKSDGEYEFLKGKANFILAGMGNINYKTESLKLDHGSEIFVYTDGVTEATNASEELYGDDRLCCAINKADNMSSEEICRIVRRDVDEFVGEAPQFDDITVLSVRYL